MCWNSKIFKIFSNKSLYNSRSKRKTTFSHPPCSTLSSPLPPHNIVICPSIFFTFFLCSIQESLLIWSKFGFLHTALLKNYLSRTICVRTMGPILQEHYAPHKSPLAAAPQPSCPTTGLLLRGYPWAILPSSLICCCSMGSSMAANGDLCHIGCRRTVSSSMGWRELLLCARSITCPLYALTWVATELFLSRLSHSALPAAAAQQFYLSKIYSPRCTPTVTHDSALPVSVSYWSWLELAVIWHRGASMFCPFPQTRLCQYNCLHFIEEGLHSVVQKWLYSDSSKIFRFLKRWLLFVLLILLLEILFFNNILSSIKIFLRTSMQIC